MHQLLKSFQLLGASPPDPLTRGTAPGVWIPLGAPPQTFGLPLCLGWNKILATALQMPFVFWTRVGARKRVLDRRHLANTTEPSMCMAAAMRPFCQITLTTCYFSCRCCWCWQKI